MAEAGTVWVSVVPSMKGFAGKLSGETVAASAVAGKKGGQAVAANVATSFAARAKKLGPVLTKGLTLPLLAIGVAGVKSAETLQGAYDTIRSGTGATGKKLEGLQATFRDVATTVPEDMGDVAKSVADLNTRLDITGPTLKTLSKQVLEVGRITGQKIDINKLTSGFQAFNVTGKDTTKQMDNLFRVSQATGVGMNDLSRMLSRNGAVLHDLGFSYKDSAAMIGVLDKAGIDSRTVVRSLGRSMTRLAKEGEKPATTFKRVSGKIEDFVKQGKDAKALELAKNVFGTRGAPQFIAALKSGKLNLDALTKSAGLTGDTILDTSKNTTSFAESWNKFKHAATIALGTVANSALPALRTAMDSVVPVVKAGADWFNNLGDTGKKAILGIGAGLIVLGPSIKIVSRLGRMVAGVGSAAVGAVRGVSRFARGISGVGTAAHAAASPAMRLGESMRLLPARIGRVGSKMAGFGKKIGGALKAVSGLKGALGVAAGAGLVGAIAAAAAGLGYLAYKAVTAQTASEKNADAIIDSATSYDSAAKQLRNNYVKAQDRVNDVTSHAILNASTLGYGLQTMSNDAAGAKQKLTDFGEHVNHVAGILGVTKNEAVAAAHRVGIDLKAGFDDSSDAAQKNRDKLESLKNTMRTSANPQSIFKAGMQQAADKTRSLEDRVNGLSGALDSLMGKNISVARSENAFQRQVNSLTQSVNANGTSLDGNSQKALNNRQAVIEATQSAQQHATAVFKQTGNIDDAKRALYQDLKALQANAVKTYGNRDSVNALLRKLGALPQQAADALGGMQGFASGTQGALDGVKNKNIAINAKGEFVGVLTDGYYRGHAKNSSMRAAGGPIAGPGTGTSDSIPAVGPGGAPYRLSNGEHVWTAREVEAVGGHGAMAAIRRAVVGRATGGPVGLAMGGPTVSYSQSQSITTPNINDWLGLALGQWARKIGAQMRKMLSTGGSTKWAPVAAQALRMLGYPMSWLGATLKQIQIESGGNPNAINLNDINAQRGHPSQGLLQTIPSTFNSYKIAGLGGITNPLANIVAALRYTVATYGSVPSIWPTRAGYDSGGIASGTGIMAKRVIQPERVLSPRQTVAFEDLVSMLNVAYRGGGGGFGPSEKARDRSGGVQVTTNVTMLGQNADEVGAAVSRRTARAVRGLA
jgi:hypothetical protein